jgi:quinol monooxygenase YgiN
MAQPLIVIARIRPKSEYFTEARDALKSILAPTQAEPGCQRFELFADLENHELQLVEAWDSESALAAHYQQPYTKAVFEAYEDWLQAPVAIAHLAPVT